MLRLDATISEETAEYARKSLEQLTPGRNNSSEESPWAMENFYRQPYQSLKKNTMEVGVAGVEMRDNLKSRQEDLRSFAEEVGVDLEDFVNTLRHYRGVRFVSSEGEPITLARSQSGTIWGILAFSRLRNCLPCVKGSTAPIELLPGGVMLYDGDATLVWKCEEGGFGLIFRFPKSKSRKDETSHDATLASV